MLERRPDAESACSSVAEWTTPVVPATRTPARRAGPRPRSARPGTGSRGRGREGVRPALVPGICAAMADAGVIVVGLIAAHDDRDLADALAEDLPPTLRDRVDGRTEWRAEVHEVEPADASATPSELIETVRRHLLDRGWQMGIGLTALPLRAGRRLVTAE